MKNALLIINPVSGRSMISEYTDDILSLLRKEGYQAQVLLTKRKDDAEYFAREYGANASLIVCCGGDGTLSETVNGVVPLQNHPVIVYIPTGTTNDFSKNMGLSGDILRSIIDLRHGVPKTIDAGRFDARYFIYVASFGLFAESSYATPRGLKQRLGHLAYVITGTKELLNLKSYRVRVTDAEGNCYEDDYIYGSVSNSTSIGGLMRFEDGVVNLRDGRHEVVLIRRPKNLHEFNDIVHHVLSGKYDSELMTVFSTSKVTVESENPIDWSLDGEHARTEKPVTIVNVPRALRLMFPKPDGNPAASAQN
ncbi:MAG: diacylglycerol kinase family lipid kinase [Ruminococcus sp.]|nr:diacylglycerol kinase family lipid kinase [Ruminococcus sp.]